MTAADRRDNDGTQRVNMARSVGSSPDSAWTAADRPSVTDNARAALLGTDDEVGALDLDFPADDGTDEQRGYIRGYARAVKIVRDTLDSLAAGRAETTTATDEDAARALFDQLWTEDRDYERAEVREIFLTGYESGVDAAGGLLATVRTRPTREQIAKVICESRSRRSWLETADAALALFSEKADQ